MLQVIQKPTPKSPIVALSFILFGHHEWGFDYQKRQDYPDAVAYLLFSKHHVLGTNIEHFRAYCEEICFPAGNRVQIAEEAINNLHEHTVWFFANKQKWQQCLESTIEKANFMRVLITNAPKEQKPFLIIMAGMIVDFCKKELDECKEDQGQVKADSGN